jgi:hypothetical protein
MAFSKTYVARSPNNQGVVHYGNQGHTVEYRGEMTGASLGYGFKGRWHIDTGFGCDDGDFHLWPAMEGWVDEAVDFDSGDTERSYVESECVVCYDRAISTRLRPCGHVALCRVCASSLIRRVCPLCRTGIDSIENHEGTMSH